MSEWHLKMQEYFPENNREIVVKSKDKIHQADILLKDTVIEFQHSPISKAEFNDRNQFFMDLGYRMTWVFDMTDRFESEQIRCTRSNDYEDVSLYAFKNPMKTFQDCPKISKNNKNFALFFDDGLYISKVVWAIRENNKTSLRRFLMSDSNFFYSEKDYDNDEKYNLSSLNPDKLFQ